MIKICPTCNSIIKEKDFRITIKITHPKGEISKTIPVEDLDEFTTTSLQKLYEITYLSVKQELSR